MLQPRIKPEHAPYRTAGGKIRMGAVSYGLAAEISDPDGWVWTMLTAMDGSRDLPEIVEHVHAAHPGQSPRVLRLGADQLVASGYVEDAAGTVPPGLTERDLDRYGRSVGYFRWLDLTPRASSWEPQALLKGSRVTVLGAGGTGGVAAQALAASGVGRLHLVDPDEVELSNLSRQVLYTEDDIGKLKVDAAVARLRRLNTDIEITGQQSEATCIADVLRLTDDCDVLVLAADRPPDLRIWTNRACLSAGRSWVWAGYHGPLVQGGAFIPGEGPCWECTALMVRDTLAEIGARTEDSPQRMPAAFHAVGAASAGLSGYLAAHQAIALLTGVPKVFPGRIETVNLVTLDASQVFDDPRHPECVACAEAG